MKNALDGIYKIYYTVYITFSGKRGVSGIMFRWNKRSHRQEEGTR